MNSIACYLWSLLDILMMNNKTVKCSFFKLLLLFMLLQGIILMNNFHYFVMLVHSTHLLYVPKD